MMPQALGRRNVQTVVAEELADQAEAAQLMKAEFPADVLLQALSLTDALDMPDQSRARLHKAIAAVISESRPAAALNHYTFALQLDPRCGVKRQKSGWSVICVTATNGTCPRTGGTGWRQAAPYQNPVHRPPFQEKTRMRFVAPEQAPEQAEVIKTPHSGPMWICRIFAA